jgi:hypothetical protein
VNAWTSRIVVTSPFRHLSCLETKPFFLHVTLELRFLDLTRDTDNTVALRAVAKGYNTRLLQVAAIGDAVADVDSPSYR